MMKVLGNPPNIYFWKQRSLFLLYFLKHLRTINTHAIKLLLVIMVSRLSQSVKLKQRCYKTFSYLFHKFAKTFLMKELVQKEFHTGKDGDLCSVILDINSLSNYK